MPSNFAPPLKPAASAADVAGYLEAYWEHVMSFSGSFSNIRYPIYAAHEKVMKQAAKLQDPWLRVDMRVGVIEGICNSPVMSSCGFPEKEVYEVGARLRGTAATTVTTRTATTTTG